MKVMLLNGSPRAKGNTCLALEECAKTLNECGIDTELFDIGSKPVSGCRACGACARLGRCVIDDGVNEFRAKLEAADGLIVGTPVYYASPNGSVISFLDRLFFSAPDLGRHKPAAAVAIARRAGTVTSFDVLSKYFTIREMPVVSATYWNDAFGQTPGQAAGDAERLQTMRNLARNMAWLLKCIELGRQNGVNAPENEYDSATNFIR